MRRTVEVSRKIFDTAQVAIDGSLGIITALEFLQHHFSEMGHGNTSCDPNLSQPTGNQRSVTSRAASAARAASCKRGSDPKPKNEPVWKLRLASWIWFSGGTKEEPCRGRDTARSKLSMPCDRSREARRSAKSAGRWEYRRRRFTGGSGDTEDWD